MSTKDMIVAEYEARLADLRAHIAELEAENSALLEHAAELDRLVGDLRAHAGIVEIVNGKLRVAMLALTTGVNGEGVRQICLEALKMTYFDKWTIEYKETKDHESSYVKIISNGYVSGDCRRPIASVNAKNPRSAENARLISAAPDLLAAANNALDALMSVKQDIVFRSVDVDAAIRQLIAAIAKAKESDK